MSVLEMALYRGKRTDSDGWASGSAVFIGGAVFISSSVSSYYESMGCSGPHCFIDCFFEVRPETVGRFTGLTDKNGVKVFEGMKVEHEKEGFGGIVSWSNDLFCFYVEHEKGESCLDSDFYACEASK